MCLVENFSIWHKIFDFSPSLRVKIHQSHSGMHLLDALECHSNQEDIFINAGGCVWALDWNMPSTKDDPSFLAISSYPDNKHFSSLTNPSQGIGVIQIWQVARDSTEENARVEKQGSTKLCFAICHSHGLVRCLKWSPHPSNQDSIGTIGVSFSDGSIELLCVPHPDFVQNLIKDMEIGVPHIFIQPSLTLTNASNSSIWQTMEWNLFENVLAVGSSDGK